MSTEEQTIALKEILGIPTNKPTPSSRSSRGTSSNSDRRAATTTTATPSSSATSMASLLSTPKQKKSKTRTDANSKEKRSSRKKTQQFIQMTANANGSTEKRIYTVQKTTGKKNKRSHGIVTTAAAAAAASTSGCGSSSVSHNEHKENHQNYAWSAFQSPPDASNLPLPAFGSLSFENDEAPSTAAVPTTTSTSTTTTSSTNTSNSDCKDAVAGGCAIASQQNNDAMLAAATTGISGINLASFALQSTAATATATTTAAATRTKNDDSDGGGDNEAVVVVAAAGGGDNDGSRKALNWNKDPMESVKSPELHRVAMSTPNKGECEPTKDDNDDPLLMLMNPSYGNSRNSSIDRNILTPPMQRSFLEPSINARDASYGGGMMMSPINNPMMAPFPMAPQPFITIQVQVPSQLFPGRRMMVPMAPGCNIPVIVPEGVQGGMIIPVTVPNVYASGAGSGAATAVSPMSYVATPMNLQSQHHGTYNNNNNFEHMYHADAAYNQPPRQSYNSPSKVDSITGEKGQHDNDGGGVTQSWAEKVASTKKSNVRLE
jgi:hypothetical protein